MWVNMCVVLNLTSQTHLCSRTPPPAATHSNEAARDIEAVAEVLKQHRPVAAHAVLDLPDGDHVEPEPAPQRLRATDPATRATEGHKTDPPRGGLSRAGTPNQRAQSWKKKYVLASDPDPARQMK